MARKKRINGWHFLVLLLVLTALLGPVILAIGFVIALVRALANSD